MADKKIIAVEVKVIETGAKKVSDGAAKVTKDLRLLTQAERLARIEAEKLKISNLAVATSLKQEAAAALQAEASLKGHKATSGLNNAILLETSRLASDASYGFQGMANNLGQIVSLMQISAQNAGGFGASLKELGKSLLGTGGVLIAVQLLISFLPKLEKAFKKSKSAVEEETAAFRENTKEVEKNLAKRKLLAGQAEGLADSFSVDFIRNFQNGLQLLDSTDVALEEIFERFNQFGVQNADIIKDETIANDARLEISFRLLDIFREETQIKNIRLKQDKELVKASEEGRAVNQSALAQFAQDIIQRRLEIKSLNEEIERLRKRGVVLTPPKEDKSGARTKGFKQGLLDLAELEERYRQQSELNFILGEEEKILKQREYSLKDLEIRVQQFKDRQALRLEEYLEDHKDEKLRADARAEYNESINKAEQEAADVKVQIYAATETKLLELEAKQNDDRVKINRKKNELEVNNLKFSLDANRMYHDEKIHLIQADIDFEKLRLSTALLSVDQRAEAELNLAKLEAELNKQRLQQNIDFINENKRVDMEYVGFVEQTGQLLATLAGENESWQKAALLVEKGAAIANIVIRTQASNAQIRAGYAATAAIKSIDPTALARYSTLATAQVQRNNVGAGLSIANILATTISSFRNPSSSGGGGGGRSNVEAPDFNVVGASPESQLAQSVSMQQNQPIKAFVVSRDMTNQQELDRVVTNTASL